MLGPLFLIFMWYSYLIFDAFLVDPIRLVHKLGGFWFQKSTDLPVYQFPKLDRFISTEEIETFGYTSLIVAYAPSGTGRTTLMRELAARESATRPVAFLSASSAWVNIHDLADSFLPAKSTWSYPWTLLTNVHQSFLRPIMKKNHQPLLIIDDVDELFGDRDPQSLIGSLRYGIDRGEIQVIIVTSNVSIFYQIWTYTGMMSRTYLFDLTPVEDEEMVTYITHVTLSSREDASEFVRVFGANFSRLEEYVRGQLPLRQFIDVKIKDELRRLRRIHVRALRDFPVTKARIRAIFLTLSETPQNIVSIGLDPDLLRYYVQNRVLGLTRTSCIEYELYDRLVGEATRKLNFWKLRPSV